MLDSITILNAPLNSFSINYIEGLLVKDIIVNNTAAEEKVPAGSCSLADCEDGDTLGHNTDGKSPSVVLVKVSNIEAQNLTSTQHSL